MATSAFFSSLAEMLERLQEAAGERARNSTRPSGRRGLYYPGGLLSAPEKGQLETALVHCGCWIVLLSGQYLYDVALQTWDPIARPPHSAMATFVCPVLLRRLFEPQLAWWEKRLLRKKNKAALEIQRVYRAHR